MVSNTLSSQHSIQPAGIIHLCHQSYRSIQVDGWCCCWLLPLLAENCCWHCFWWYWWWCYCCTFGLSRLRSIFQIVSVAELHHCRIASLTDCVIVRLCQLPNCIIAEFHHCQIASLSDCVSCRIASLSNFIIVRLRHCQIVSVAELRHC